MTATVLDAVGVFFAAAVLVIGVPLGVLYAFALIMEAVAPTFSCDAFDPDDNDRCRTCRVAWIDHAFSRPRRRRAQR